MEFGEVVRRRRMVRAYDPDRTVDPAVLETVLEAARRTPSAGFTQGVALLVLTADADRAAFWRLGVAGAPGAGGPPDRWLAGMSSAPVLVLVWTSEAAYRARYAEPDKRPASARDGRAPGQLPWSVPYWWVDAGMSVQALLYAAVDAGLGAAFAGVPEAAVGPVAGHFGVPHDRALVGVVTLGHPATSPGAAGSAARRGRRPRSEVIHHAHWSDECSGGKGPV